MKANRQKGKGNKAIECPECHGNLTAMTGRNKQGLNAPIPNRRYCFNCDRMWKFTMTLE